MDSTPHSMVPIIQFIWPSYWKDNLKEIKNIDWPFFSTNGFKPIAMLANNKHWQSRRKTPDTYHQSNDSWVNYFLNICINIFFSHNIFTMKPTINHLVFDMAMRWESVILTKYSEYKTQRGGDKKTLRASIAFKCSRGWAQCVINTGVDTTQE